MKFRILTLALGLAAGSMAHAGADTPSDGTSKSVQDGVYSSEQAVRGKAIYEENCTGCHGGDLKTPSGPAAGPPLAGAFFMNRWKDKSTAELAQFIQEMMPLGQGGLLNQQQTIDIVAYVYQANSFPAGSAELKPEAPELGQIRIQPKAAK